MALSSFSFPLVQSFRQNAHSSAFWFQFPAQYQLKTSGHTHVLLATIKNWVLRKFQNLLPHFFFSFLFKNGNNSTQAHRLPQNVKCCMTQISIMSSYTSAEAVFFSRCISSKWRTLFFLFLVTGTRKVMETLDFHEWPIDPFWKSLSLFFFLVLFREMQLMIHDFKTLPPHPPHPSVSLSLTAWKYMTHTCPSPPTRFLVVLWLWKADSSRQADPVIFSVKPILLTNPKLLSMVSSWPACSPGRGGALGWLQAPTCTPSKSIAQPPPPPPPLPSTPLTQPLPIFSICLICGKTYKHCVWLAESGWWAEGMCAYSPNFTCWLSSRDKARLWGKKARRSAVSVARM